MAIKIIKKEGGFTLLELLIVIVIIAILALLILPNLTSAPKKARDTTRKTDITAIRKALEEYFVDNNVYPTSGAWQTNLTSGTAPLMKAVPADPKPGWPAYTYTPGSGNTTYTIAACLENDGDKGSDTYATSQGGAPSGCTTRIFELVNAN